MRSVIAAALLGNSAVMALVARDTCAVLCNSTFDTCIKNAGVPLDAWCVSQLTTCIGHAPEIKDGHVVPPTECGPATTTGSSIPTSSSIPPATTTTAPAGDDCATKCMDVFNPCVSNVNQPLNAWCVSQLTKCVGFSPEVKDGHIVPPTSCKTAPPSTTTTAPSGDDCATKCMDVFNPCVSNVNQPLNAWCVSQLTKCVGFSPEVKDGHIVPPTTCKTAPPSTTTTAPSGDDCATKCMDVFNPCVSNVNQPLNAWCVSQLTKCVGFSPEVKDGHVVPPTTCKTAPPSSTTSAPSGKDCATQCMDVFNPCVSNVNQPLNAWCVNQLKTCIGYAPEVKDGHVVPPTTCSKGTGSPTGTGQPTGTGGPSTVPTAAAGQLQPALFLAALGAAALL